MEKSGQWIIQNILTFIKFAILYGQNLWKPKTMAIITSKIIDHFNKYSNNETVQNIVKITKV